jgi:hypothetical protein
LLQGGTKHEVTDADQRAIITPRFHVLLEEFTAADLVKKFSAFMEPEGLSLRLFNKNVWSYNSTPPTRLHDVVLCKAQGQFFTLYSHEPAIGPYPQPFESSSHPISLRTL